MEEALRSIGRACPDVLLLDIDLPGMPGSEGVVLFKQKCPALEILMLTVHAGAGESLRVYLQRRLRLSVEGNAPRKTP